MQMNSRHQFSLFEGDIKKRVVICKTQKPLFEVLDIEDNYVEAPILLLKMNRHLK